MLELLIYPAIGFAFTYLALEIGWHFMACKVDGGRRYKPCVFKEAKTVLRAIS